MADASEALQAIFHAVHRACAPDTPGAASRGVWRNRNAPRNTRGAFLDEESRYRSLAHDIFGLDVDESVACGSCGAKTHALRYTKFLHLLPVAALNDACRGLTEKKAGAFAGGKEEAKGRKEKREKRDAILSRDSRRRRARREIVRRRRRRVRAEAAPDARGGTRQRHAGDLLRGADVGNRERGRRDGA
jgi:hypothetical protein